MLCHLFDSDIRRYSEATGYWQLLFNEAPQRREKIFCNQGFPLTFDCKWYWGISKCCTSQPPVEILCGFSIPLILNAGIWHLKNCRKKLHQFIFRRRSPTKHSTYCMLFHLDIRVLCVGKLLSIDFRDDFWGESESNYVLVHVKPCTIIMANPRWFWTIAFRMVLKFVSANAGKNFKFKNENHY